MKDSTKVRLWHGVRLARKVLNSAGEVLDHMENVRNGGPLEKGLAIANFAGIVLDHVAPEGTPEDYLRAMGFEDAETGLAGYVYSTLAKSELPSSSVDIGHGQSIRFWETKPEAGREGSVAFVVDRTGEVAAGPYVPKGNRGVIGEAIRDETWSIGDSVMISSEGGGTRDRRRSASKVRFVARPCSAPGVYFGSPGLDYYVNRIKQHPGDATRSMLLIGPSGAGKSTLARLIAAEVGEGRTLKLSNRVTRECSIPDVLDFVTFLRPTVLLIDDVSLIADTENGGSDRMLELMESLHGNARLVIATLMYEGSGDNLSGRRHAPAATDEAGEDYFDGMRPGRIDDIMRIRRPPVQVRRKILLHYLNGEDGMREFGITPKILDDVAERAEGMTGAYLMEVAYRLRVHGVQTYKSEVKSVLAACPRQAREWGGRRRLARRRRLKRKKGGGVRDKLLARVTELEKSGADLSEVKDKLPLKTPSGGKWLHSAKELNAMVDAALLASKRGGAK